MLLREARRNGPALTQVSVRSVGVISGVPILGERSRAKRFAGGRYLPFFAWEPKGIRRQRATAQQRRNHFGWLSFAALLAALAGATAIAQPAVAAAMDNPADAECEKMRLHRDPHRVMTQKNAVEACGPVAEAPCIFLTGESYWAC